METDRRPAEDLDEVADLFAEAVARRSWDIAEQAAEVAMRIVDYAHRHGQHVDP